MSIPISLIIGVQARLSSLSKEMKLLSYGIHIVVICPGCKILALPSLPYCSPRIVGQAGDSFGKELVMNERGRPIKSNF